MTTRSTISQPQNRIAVQIMSAKHKLDGTRIASVVCHRAKENSEQYLVRWKTERKISPSKIPYSWHSVEELNGLGRQELYPLQLYVDSIRFKTSTKVSSSVLTNSRKRKESPNSNTSLERRPSPYNRASGSPSAVASDHQVSLDDLDTYNCRKQTKTGKIGVELVSADVDSSLLPTKSMLDDARSVSTKRADAIIRDRFKISLEAFRKNGYSSDYPVTFENKVDDSSPSLNYKMVDDYAFLNDMDRPDPEFVIGCESCRPHMGRHVGCEYTKLCECLEDAAVDEGRLNEEERRVYEKEKAKKQKDPSHIMVTEGLPKRSPYFLNGTLVSFYLNSRHVVYECNFNCACGPNCRTKVTVNRRQVPLQIFKTKDRGWGLRCPQALKKGQFVDFYYGELIPVEESNRRMKAATREKNSYVFALDKFNDFEQDPETGEYEQVTVHTYDVDGEFVGGPSRYINHSCDPSCRQVVVSWCKYDRERYNLALFAIDDIPATTELTFDYVDLEDVEGEQEEEIEDEESVPCRCGAENCRKWLWRR